MAVSIARAAVPVAAAAAAVAVFALAGPPETPSNLPLATAMARAEAALDSGDVSAQWRAFRALRRSLRWVHGEASRPGLQLGLRLGERLLGDRPDRPEVLLDVGLLHLRLAELGTKRRAETRRHLASAAGVMAQMRMVAPGHPAMYELFGAFEFVSGQLEHRDSSHGAF